MKNTEIDFSIEEKLNNQYMIAKSHLQAGLVNYTRLAKEQRELLYHLDMPKLDLTLCFFLNIMEHRLFLTKSMVKEWGVPTQDIIYQLALENTMKNAPGKFYVGRHSSKPADLENMSDLDMYQLKNGSGILMSKGDQYRHGATAILYPGLLKQICNLYGENIVIIPSSIKKVITRPSSIYEDVDELMSLVPEENKRITDPKNVLSDYPYEYCANIDSIRVLNSEEWFPVTGFFGML